MKFLSMRELRSSTAQIKEMLANDGNIIVTNNGKPAAIMLEIGEDSFEETLAAIRQMRVLQVVRQIQRDSVRNGTDGMTMEEIDAEIAAARRERV